MAAKAAPPEISDAQLIARCLDATDVSFGIYYGISNNPRQFWDISHAREEIGYEPVDRSGE